MITDIVKINNRYRLAGKKLTRRSALAMLAVLPVACANLQQAVKAAIPPDVQSAIDDINVIGTGIAPIIKVVGGLGGQVGSFFSTIQDVMDKVRSVTSLVDLQPLVQTLSGAVSGIHGVLSGVPSVLNLSLGGSSIAQLLSAAASLLPQVVQLVGLATSVLGRMPRSAMPPAQARVILLAAARA